MKYIGIGLIYLGFFSLIGFTVYFTKSAYPLFGLILMPRYRETDENKEGNK